MRVVQTSSDVLTVGVYSKLGSVTMRMTVKMDQTKLDVFILRAQTGNLRAPTSDVSPCHKLVDIRILSDQLW